MKKAQIHWVSMKLREDGFISRNDCLKNYISRLGAIVNQLIIDGWKFEKQSEGVFQPRWGKNVDGDYVYYLISAPKGVKKLL